MSACEEVVNVSSDWRETVERKRERSTAVLYAERRLSEWAKWAKQNRDGLGYPTISMLYRAMKERLEPDRKRETIPALRPDELPRLPTALGKETRSIVAPKVEAPEAVMEVDKVVRKLPKDLHDVIIADYFTYGPIEVRAKKTKWKRARYSQLLECAKYSVFVALDSRTQSEEAK